MTADLRDLFSAAADDERAAASPLDVDSLLAQAHRRRTVHATTYSAIGVGVAAAVTLGAVSADGLWRTDEPPVPPATASPTPRPTETPEARPTPSATPPPTPTPTEVAWAPNWALCGMPGEDLFLRDTADAMEPTMEGWWIDSNWPWDTSVPVDSPFPLELGVVGGWELDLGTADARLLDVVAVAYDTETYESGAVVGVAAVPVDAVGHGQTDVEGGLPLETDEMSFVSCSASPLTGGNGSLDTALPDGNYHVVALAETTWEGGQNVTSVSVVGFLGDTELSDPGPIPPQPTGHFRYLTAGTPLLLASDQTNNHTVQGAAAPYKCQAGASYAAPDPSAPVEISGTAFLRDGELIVRMTLTNTSAEALSQSFVSRVSLFVNRGDQRLAWALDIANSTNFDFSSYIPPGPFPEGQWYDVGVWPAGQSFDVEFALGTTNCLDEPWSAGVYDVTVFGDLMTPGLNGPVSHAIKGGPSATQVG